MPFKINILDTNGNVTGEFDLADQYIELEKGEQAVHDAVTAILAGKRAGTASTKTKAEVSGGGAKPWRQKGTGRARAGSNRSPIWRHGGITFGPKPRSFAKTLNKKVKKLALKRAFSERVRDNEISIITEIKLSDHKTKNFAQILKNLKIDSNTLVLVQNHDPNIQRATANIKKLEIEKASEVNTYQILLHKKVLINQDALETFLKRLI